MYFLCIQRTKFSLPPIHLDFSEPATYKFDISRRRHWYKKWEVREAFQKRHYIKAECLCTTLNQLEECSVGSNGFNHETSMPEGTCVLQSFNSL